MAIRARDLKIGTELPPVVKHMTQARMNIFSGGGRADPTTQGGFHTNPEAARRQLGVENPIASGRMSLGYACEALCAFFGDDVFNHTGTVDLKNIKPVVHGDTITIRGRLSKIEPVKQGQLVTFEISCENQNGVTTSVGSGSAVVPS